MIKSKLTAEQQVVLSALRTDHLTSFQILEKVDNISLILVVYNIIDELKCIGILKTYSKENKKYHYTC